MDTNNRYFSMSYMDNITNQNITVTYMLPGPHISNYLNAMVGMLRVIGFGDKSIEDMIGSTFFEDVSYNGEF